MLVEVSSLFLKKYSQWLNAVFNTSDVVLSSTPREVIWQNDEVRLWRYFSKSTSRFDQSILFVYALINKPYIFDLAPNKSIIEFLTGRGWNIFLLDWGNPSRERTWSEYISHLIPQAIHQTLLYSNSEKLNLFGYCMGGTMALEHAALFLKSPIQNLVLMAAPVDFDWRKAGVFGKRILLSNVDFICKIYETIGVVPYWWVEYSTKMLDPLENYYLTYQSLWLKILQEKDITTWKLINKWIRDGIDFPLEPFRIFYRDHYQLNKLVQGKLVVNDVQLDLKRINLPILNIVFENDDLVPLGMSEALAEFIRPALYSVLKLRGGHVGSVINPKSGLWEEVDKWLTSHSDLR